VIGGSVDYHLSGVFANEDFDRSGDSLFPLRQ